MFNEPGHSSWDLSWTMFGIHIRVSPVFWITSAFLGFGLCDTSPVLLLVWVGCVFVSVLTHEMGHVLMGRVFGSNGRIVLQQFGGVAIGASNLIPRYQRFLVSFAGPGVQFLMVPGLYYLKYTLPFDANPMLVQAVLFLLMINIFWPILNLLPIYPLDGGRMTREVCEAIGGHTNGTKGSLLLSMVFAGLLAGDVLSREFLHHSILPFVPNFQIPGLEGYQLSFGPITALFFVMFAYLNYQEWSQLQPTGPRRYDDDRNTILDRRRPRRRDKDLPWERPDDRVKRGPDDSYHRRDDELPWER